MLIAKESHLDHGLNEDHIKFIKDKFGKRDSFFIETVELPEHLPSLKSALYGPVCGDAPIPEEKVHYKKREGRDGPSRMIFAEMRDSRKLTVIAGPHEGEACILYTAFGGPLAPKEVFEDESQESKRFWAEHALADPS